MGRRARPAAKLGLRPTRHYSGVFRPRKRLPSVWQFNRRVNHERTRLILSLVHEALAGPLTATALSYLDGKPLTVGVASKDPDAARGHVMGGFAKGYKLHAWMTEDRRIPLWCVMPLNTGEVPIARLLVEQVHELSPRSLTLADSNYATRTTCIRNWMRAADDCWCRCGRIPRPGGVTPCRSGRWARRGAARRELIHVRHEHLHLVRLVYRQRINAEGILGNLCGYGGGLTTLPPWVRRLRRVRRWVGGKIILYHARLRVRSQRKRAA